MQEQKKYNLADGNIRKHFVTYKQAAELYSIGWSLRDYSKTNPDWVRNFVESIHNVYNHIQQSLEDEEDNLFTKRTYLSESLVMHKTMWHCQL